MGIGAEILQYSREHFPQEAIRVFGRDLFVRSLSALQAEHVDAAAGLRMARIVVWSLIDGSGNQVFSDSDVEAVANLPAGEIKRIVEVCNALTLPADDDVKKNSTPELNGSGTI